MVPPSSEAISCCCISNTFPKMGIGLALALAVTAAALIAIGHLQSEDLILPGYYVAGASGAMAVIALLGFSSTGCYNSLAARSLDDYKGGPAENPYGFQNTIVRPYDNGLGGIILPHQHVQLHPNDMHLMDLKPGDPVFCGQNVYTALASNNVSEHSIGLSSEDSIGLRVTGIPANGLLRKFDGVTTVAAHLSVELSFYYLSLFGDKDKQALFYDVAYLQQQLNQKLRGQIFKDKQLIHVTLDEGIKLNLHSLNIPQGEYHMVDAQTQFNICKPNVLRSSTIIPFHETVPIADATFTFIVRSVSHQDGYLYYPEYTAPTPQEIEEYKTDGIDLTEEEPPTEIRPMPNLIPPLASVQAQVRDAKSKPWSLPGHIGIVPLDAFWKEFENFYFYHGNIRYCLQLDEIAANGRTYQYAVTGTDLMPKEIKISIT